MGLSDLDMLSACRIRQSRKSICVVIARLVLELISMATLPPTPGVKIATAAVADDSDLADVPSRLSVSPPPLHMEPAEGREC